MTRKSRNLIKTPVKLTSSSPLVFSEYEGVESALAHHQQQQQHDLNNVSNVQETVDNITDDRQSNIQINRDTIMGPPMSSGADLMVASLQTSEPSRTATNSPPPDQNPASFTEDYNSSNAHDVGTNSNDNLQNAVDPTAVNAHAEFNVGVGMPNDNMNSSAAVQHTTTPIQNRRFSLQEYESYELGNNGYHNESSLLAGEANNAHLAMNDVVNSTDMPATMANLSHHYNQPSSAVLKKRPGRPKGSKNKPKDIRFSLNNSHPYMNTSQPHPSQMNANNSANYAALRALSQHHPQYERTSPRLKRRRQRIALIKYPTENPAEGANIGVGPSAMTGVPMNNAINSHNSLIHHQQSLDINSYYNHNQQQQQVLPSSTNNVPVNHESGRVSPHRTSSNRSNDSHQNNYVTQNQEMPLSHDIRNVFPVCEGGYPSQLNLDASAVNDNANYHQSHGEFATESLVQHHQHLEHDNEFRSVRVLSTLPASDVFKREIIERINSVADELGTDNSHTDQPKATCFLYCNSMDYCIERETLLAKNIVFITNHGFMSIVHQKIYVVQSGNCNKSSCTYVIHEHSLPIALVSYHADHFTELL